VTPKLLQVYQTHILSYRLKVLANDNRVDIMLVSDVDPSPIGDRHVPPVVGAAFEVIMTR
jgi:hypothetical protein